MKKLLCANLIIAFVITVYSCSDNKSNLGEWDDCIKLSTKDVEFNSLENSVIVKTGGTGWWVTHVSVNNDCFYSFGNVNPRSDKFLIELDCFVVERRDKNTLYIKLNENPLNVERIITVGLEAGDYFDRIKITQNPK